MGQQHDMSELDALIVGPEDGSAVPILAMWAKVDTQLDGRLLVMEGEIAPGQLILPHTHTREDECAYVLAGELTYQLGEDVRTVTAGSYVVKPKGIPHAFWNAGADPARVIEMHVPGQMTGFYAELAAIFEADEPGSAAWQRALAELNDRYGIIQHWDRVAEISARYGVGASRS
ncbi:MAG: cupin protein [Pseudonocardiales bacterium]|jgi:mannose-6-phosphate isomerase-like protein (cupin superfamily)|nr:cupin protein [Pseudonocardiales bacterium]